MPESNSSVPFDPAEKFVQLLIDLKVPPLIARLLVAVVKPVGGKALSGTGQRTEKFLRKHIKSYDKLKEFLEKNVFPEDTAALDRQKLRDELNQQFGGIFSVLDHLDVLLGELSEAPVKHVLRIPQSLPLNPESAFSLLQVYNEFVPLIGREEEMERLFNFLKSNEPFQWAVITGPGGIGKSRLALEFAKRAANGGWAAGFLDANGLESLVSHPQFPAWTPVLDTLIVMDYAASKKEWLQKLLKRGIEPSKSANGDDIGRLRMILLERQASEKEGWLADILTLPEKDIPEKLRQTLWYAPQWELSPPGAGDRVGSTRVLIKAAADKWRSLISSQDIPDVASLNDKQITNLVERTQGKPLYLIAAAINAFHNKSLQALIDWDWKRLLYDLVGWEKKRWDKILDGEHNPELFLCVRQAAAAVHFMGHGLNPALKNFIEWDIEKLGYRRSLDVGLVLDGLEKVLRRDESGNVQSLGPDIPAEAFAVAALREKTGRVDPAAALKKMIGETKRGAWPQLFRACADLRYTEEYREIEEWLKDVFKRLKLDELRYADNIMPNLDRNLGFLRAKLNEQIVLRLRESGEDSPELSGALNNYAVALSRIGRRTEALGLAEEAVGFYRRLAEKRPEAFLPGLATSLNNLATSLSEVGRRAEALEPAEEAVGHYRRLAEKNPEAFLPDLAMSLGALGSILLGLDRAGEAVLHFAEGVRSILPFTRQLPAAFTPLLANLLSDYATACEQAGQEPEPNLVRKAQTILKFAEGEKS